jgi:putative DNA primase/helicase
MSARADGENPLRDPEISHALAGALEAMRRADTDHGKLLAVRNGAEALDCLGDDGSGALDELSDSAIYVHHLDPDVVQAVLAQGVDLALKSRAVRMNGNAVSHYKTRTKGGGTPPEKKRRKLTFDRLVDIEPQPVCWLWPDRIPRKFVLFTGPPDCGKTNTAIDVAARVTTGNMWPDGSGRAPLASVIFLTAEDGLADTIRTRADAAKADVRRIYCLDVVHDENGKASSFSLQEDLVLLGEKVREIGDVALIVVDPITAYLGAGRIDTHKTADVRAVLSPLKDFAEHHNITVLGLTHPSKTVTKAMNAATGSQAFIAAARSAYLFTRESNDGQETGRTLMLPIKNNLGPRKEGLAFRIGQQLVCDGRIVAPYVDWDSTPITMSADDALAAAMEASGGGSGGRDAMAEAVFFLREEFSASERVEACIIERQGKKAGISKRTLERARKELGVVSKREGFGPEGKFFLSLPRLRPIDRQDLS